MSDAALDLGFDPDALREKYRQERDKRIRQDGNEQYQEVKGEFAHYVEDHFPALQRLQIQPIRFRLPQQIS